MILFLENSDDDLTPYVTRVHLAQSTGICWERFRILSSL